MFGSTSPFGQSSTSPFGSPSVFEQSNNESSNPFTPKPFGCTTPFGSPTGGSIFSGPSTGVFEENSLAPAFGVSLAPAFGVSSAPAFGGPSSICGSSIFDKKPTFGGFASSPNPSNSYGSLFQQSQTAFGSSPFGMSTSFGASTQNVSASSPAFGAPSTSPFGVASTQTFGSTGTACVVSNSPAFGFGTGSAFGATNTLGSSNTFSEVSNTTAFGASRPPTFGTTSTAGFGFGINPTRGQLSPVSGSSSLFGTATSVFGTQSSSLGAQSKTPTFGTTGFGQSAFGRQHGGSRVVAYTATAEVDGGSNTQPAAKLQSISAMHINKDKNHEELRWENYQMGDRGGPRCVGQSAGEIGIWGSAIRSNSFGPSPALAQSSFNPLHSSTRSNPFNSQTSSAPFEAQSTTQTFGTTGFGQLAFGGQHRGSRVASYIATAELVDDGSSSQSAGKMQSISTMPINKDKTHEELRWEDYQLGDKGGPRHMGQSAGSIRIGGSTIQSNSFGPSPTLAQSSANLFNSSTVSNPVAPQTSSNPFSIPVFSSPFSSRTSSNTFSTQVSSSTYVPKTSSNTFSLCPFAPQSSTVFAPQTSSNTFSFPFTPQTSTIFAPQTPSFSFAPQISSNHFSPQSSSNIFAPKTTAPSSMGSITSVPAFGPNSTPFFSPAIVPLPSIFASTSALGTASGFSSSSSQPNIFSASSTGSQLGENLFSDMPSLLSMSNPAGFSQITPTQTDQSSVAVQSMAFANAFGAVTAMPQLSVSHCGSTPSIQYGISSMPVLDKPAAPVRMSSLLTSRHLSQRRGRLPAWKHNPKSDGPKVPFFSNDKEMAAALRNDALPVPRENPRASVILPAEQWPQRSDKEKMSPLVSASLHVYKNGKISAELCASASLNGSICQDEDDRLDESSTDKEGSSSTKPNDKPNDECHYNFPNKGSFPIRIPRSEASEAATLKIHVADVEALLPRLRLSEYYTEPQISELAVKERTEPGFCSRVKDFVVGRHGYGNIKFLGETDVRQLDLDSHVHFNTREVIVYMDESKKPPLGQGLNKPAEVSLFNVKCISKKTGKQYINGPVVDKYREMLIKKAAEQGAEFVSFDPVGGEWKFKVQHFSQYEFRDDSKCAGSFDSCFL